MPCWRMVNRAVQRLYSNTDDTASIMPQFWTDLEAEEVVLPGVSACARAPTRAACAVCALAILPL